MNTHYIKQHYKLVLVSLLVGALLGIFLWKVARFAYHGYHGGYDKRGGMMDMRGKSGMMRHSSMNMMSGLEGKTGVELEKAFLTQMIPHHEGAVEMAEMLLKGNVRPELQTLAKSIIENQTTEINEMKDWLTNWYK